MNDAGMNKIVMNDSKMKGTDTWLYHANCNAPLNGSVSLNAHLRVGQNVFFFSKLVLTVQESSLKFWSVSFDVFYLLLEQH